MADPSVEDLSRRKAQAKGYETDNCRGTQPDIRMQSTEPEGARAPIPGVFKTSVGTVVNARTFLPRFGGPHVFTRSR